MGKKVKEKEDRFVLPVLPGNDPMQQLQALWRGVQGQVNGWYGCTRCGLSQLRSGNEIVFADGNPRAKVMIVGDAPSEEDAQAGVPFIDAAGKLLNQILSNVSDDPEITNLSRWFRRAPRTQQNIDLFHDKVASWRNREFFITNIVSCRSFIPPPPGGGRQRAESRPPTKDEVGACFERLHQMIYLVDPWIIIATGKSALEGLLRRKVGIEKVRGQVLDMTIEGRVGPVSYPVMGTFHPAYLLRKADWATDRGDFHKTVRDFAEAMRIVDFLKEKHLGIPVPERGWS